jgi:hypothetical protein
MGTGKTALVGTAMMALVGWAGCEAAGPLPTQPNQVGNMGNGTFLYECSSSADTACAVTTPDLLPTVALGSRFNLGFTPKTSINNIGNPGVVVVSPEYAKSALNGFLSLKEGRAGFAVETSTDGRVIDFTDVEVVAPLGLTITETVAPGLDAGAEGEAGAPDSGADAGAITTLVLRAGAEAYLAVVPIGTSNAPLAGSIDATWTTSNPAAVKLLIAGVGPTMQISAVGAGAATLTVASGTIQTTLSVVVN